MAVKKIGNGSPGPVPATGSGRTTLVEMLSATARERSRVQRFAAGDAIVREDEPGGMAFILLSGSCEVSIRGDRLNVIRPNELFGDIACLEQSTRTATVRAVMDSEVLEVPADVLLMELQQSAPLLEEFLRALAHRVRSMSQREASVRHEHLDLRRVLDGLRPPLDRYAAHPFMSVEVQWRPLTFASGDYYDVLELSPTRFLFAVGDVIGHGAATAPTFGMIRSQLHEYATAGARPHELLGHLHLHLRRHGHTNAYLTLTLLVLDSAEGTAEFAVAGPPAPVMFSFSSGCCRVLTDQVDWTLGYPFDGVEFHSETIPVSSGDRLLLYTDGLSDAACGPDPDCVRLGTDGVLRIFAELCQSCHGAVAESLFDKVDQHRAGWPAEDDATALVIAIR